MKKLFMSAATVALFAFALCTSSCKDDEEFSDVDGQNPSMTLTTDHIESGAGHDFTIAGQVADADGIASINLSCADLYLDKTINLLEIYKKPLNEYELSYTFSLSKDEVGEQFTVKVTVTDIGGRTESKDVLITMDGDFNSPEFTLAPDKQMTVLLKENTQFKLSFTVTDDRAMDYVTISIPGIEGFENKKIDAEGKASVSYSDKITLPNEVKNYDVTLTAVDKKGNQVTNITSIQVSEMPDFTKMYLADVATTEELNSDVFGVPMLINHPVNISIVHAITTPQPGTEIFFLPQRTDFTPICFGLDPEDSNKLTDDPESAQPIVLEQAGVYYEINFDVKKGTYDIITYPVSEATVPYKQTIGEATFDVWENGSEFIDFQIGWGGSPQDAGNHLFTQQDANNPHLLTYPAQGETWSVEAGEMNFIISNYHPSGWWDHVEWRCDNSTDPEKFGYFSKKNDVNPNWEGTNRKWSDGTNVEDNWVKPTVVNAGNYVFTFDAHLGRGKMVPAK